MTYMVIVDVCLIKKLELKGIYFNSDYYNNYTRHYIAYFWFTRLDNYILSFKKLPIKFFTANFSICY